MSQSRHAVRTSLALGTGALALVTLAACGSSSSASDSSASGSAPSSQASGAAQGRGAGSFQGRNPGTTGQIAAKQGSTLQVQNQTDGQVAVSYTAKTAITAQVAATLKDVKVGSCVTVTPVMSSSAGTSGSASSGTSTSLAAGTVRISTAVNGQCTGGFGGGPGGFGGGSRPSSFPSGMATARPSGFPTSRPSGFTGGHGGMMFANGKVTAVSGSGFTVANSFTGRGSAGSSTGASTAPTSVQVTVSGSTTYTITKSSDASALKVGKCVVATGQADSTGAVAADRLVVSDPVNGSCESGFGFGGRGGQGAPGGQSGQSGQQGGAA